MTQEALRYLGVRGQDANMERLVREGFAALGAAAPSHVTQALSLQEVLAAFPSRSLSAHLKGAAEAALLAATLGAEADRVIRRAEAVDTALATVIHACAAAKIEAYVDAVHAAIPGARATRFSPGYGDFSLAAQKELLSLTDAGRRLGLYLTDGCMLVPTKSITAIIGIGGEGPGGCRAPKCAACPMRDCAFRKEAPECPC